MGARINNATGCKQHWGLHRRVTVSPYRNKATPSENRYVFVFYLFVCLFVFSNLLWTFVSTYISRLGIIILYGKKKSLSELTVRNSSPKPHWRQLQTLVWCLYIVSCWNSDVTTPITFIPEENEIWWYLTRSSSNLCGNTVRQRWFPLSGPVDRLFLNLSGTLVVVEL